jgi:membrane-anchored glycerophosphoryl diester phosphodiesterase (GDPDase)
MLPHIALENATVGEAWASVWARISAEKKEFLVYALLRVALPIVAGIGLFLLLLIPGLVLAGSLAAVEYGIHSVFADSTGASAVVGILIEVFFALLAFAFTVLASICLGGPLGTGIREYAIIFYGGRYQALGDRLYPTPPPAIAGGPSEIV